MKRQDVTYVHAKIQTNNSTTWYNDFICQFIWEWNCGSGGSEGRNSDGNSSAMKQATPFPSVLAVILYGIGFRLGAWLLNEKKIWNSPKGDTLFYVVVFVFYVVVFGFFVF